jgi:hypothetical protein
MAGRLTDRLVEIQFSPLLAAGVEISAFRPETVSSRSLKSFHDYISNLES